MISIRFLIALSREWVIRPGSVDFLRRLSVIVLALTLAAGCAARTVGENKEDFQNEEIADPLEPMNRVFFDFNQFLDTLLLRPAAEIYRNICCKCTTRQTV